MAGGEQKFMMAATWPQQIKRVFTRQRSLTLLVVALAIIPRVLNLGVFRIIDEEHLWEWTEQFSRAVLARDWQGTAITAYPGLPFFWVQFIRLSLEMARRALAQGEWLNEAGVYLLFHEWSRDAFLAQRRLLLGIVNGGLVVGLYLLVRRLFGERIGLGAGILLALDPFLLSEARVARVEALSAEFAGLAVLALLLYLRQQRWRWLILSSIAGGLALSTKSQNLLLVGFAGLAIAGYWLRRGQSEGWGRSLQRMVPAGLFWLFLALLAFVLVWPAMWVNPGSAITLISDYASTHATDPEYQELYFLGQTVVGRDPGPLFYIVVFFWRMTPWTLIGLISALIWLAREREDDPGPWSRRLEVFTLVAFVLLYAAGMSLGAHKRTRYVLPLFPVVDVVAAVGLDWLGQITSRRWPANRRARRLAGPSLVGVLLLGQSMVVLPHHPYYYDFYNPLLGGGPVAVKLIRIGWGEGMDQVAAYLNTRPKAEHLNVASRFGKYMVGFKGRVITLDTSWQWLQTDYVVFYVQQVQKMLEPSPGIIRYFQRQTPEWVVRLGGIEYAWIYANPIQHPANPHLSTIPGQATLLGYSWLQQTEPLQVKVVWQNEGLAADQAIALRLVSEAQAEAGDWRLCRTAPDQEAAAYTPGEVAESVCDLPAGRLPPGLGGLEFAVRDGAGRFTPIVFPQARTAFRVAEAGGAPRLPLTRAEIYDAAVSRTVPATATSLQMNYAGQARLVGYELQPETLLPGDALAVTLYWQALQPLTLDYHEFVKLLDPSGRPVGQIDQAPPLPTSRWWPGEVISDTIVVPVEDDLTPPILLQLDAGLIYLPKLEALPAFNVEGQEIPRTVARVKMAPREWPDLAEVKRVSYVFAGALALVGVQLPEGPVTAGEALPLQLYWASLAQVNDDYTVFVHLMDESGTLAGQGDGPPVNGHYPTSAWRPNEVILDTHSIPIAAGMPPGRYRLVVGLYDAASGARLPLTSSPGNGSDAIDLGVVHVQ